MVPGVTIVIPRPTSGAIGGGQRTERLKSIEDLSKFLANLIKVLPSHSIYPLPPSNRLISFFLPTFQKCNVQERFA